MQNEYNGDASACPNVRESSPHDQPELFALPMPVHEALEPHVWTLARVKSVLKIAASYIEDQELADGAYTVQVNQYDIGNLIQEAIHSLTPAISGIEDIWGCSDTAHSTLKKRGES